MHRFHFRHRPVLARRGWIAVLLAGLSLNSIRADDLGVRVPDGFEVTLFADDDLAHDIYSLTIDSFGRIVVSGAGYTRILLDEDGDGRAEKVKQYVAGPKTGAQGMYFYGRDLICSGDGGVIRYRDRNGDDQADGPPDVFLKIKAGNEHDVHAIRKGPDGWWYIIAGNMAGVDEKYATLPTSPVKKPSAGTLLRLKPDLTGGEIYADGFRNAYDFDFNAVGDLYTFDSDGEREITLPWYLPTRVFHVLPGSNAGWFSRNWKRPDYFLDMPPVLAAFGRGSPTGVVCYQHTQFPAPYPGALFVLDWTYGRVFALPLEAKGSVWSTKPIEFMTAVGQHGFAPTDADVAPDGSLYVSVGGRGTRGGVYRIRATRPGPVQPAPAESGLSNPEKLQACLTAPQPLSSWSRRRWEPLAEQIGSDALIRAALDERRPAPERVRAIEIVTEKFRGIDADMAEWLTRASSPEVRARAVWSLGRTQTQLPNPQLLGRFLNDDHPLVARSALEALSGAQETAFDGLVDGISKQLGSPDRFVRQSAARVLDKPGDETYHAIAAAARPKGWAAAARTASAYAARKPGYSAFTVDVALRIIKGRHPPELKLEAARLMQIGLGDVVPSEGTVEGVFEGYASRLDLSEHAAELTTLVKELEQLYPTRDKAVDAELGRVIAMLQPGSAALLDKVLAPVTAESHPVDDIHQLIIAARIAGERTPQQRQLVARALLALEPKIQARKLPQDSNWDDRVLEMYFGLVGHDSALPVALLEHRDFGRPGHVLYIAAFPPERLEEAISAFVARMRADRDYPWSSEIVFLLGQSRAADVRRMVRDKFDDFALRNSVLATLAERPEPEDRARFVAGLEAAPLDVLTECIKALALLGPGKSPAEIVALTRTMRRLGYQKEERELRDQVVELLQLNTRQDFGYVLGRDGDPQQPGIDRWTAWVRQNYADEYGKQDGGAGEDLDQLRRLLARVDWDHGDATRGAQLFETRACSRCHGSRRALGPDLAGVAGRFSREDLFVAIALPNRDVSPRYQTTMIATHDGQIYTGLIVYESVDGLVLRDGNNRTFRIETEQIESRRTLATSLMPAGLLKDLVPQDLSDLNAYLRGLGVQTAKAPQADSASE